MNISNIKNFDYQSFAVIALIKVILAIVTVALGAMYIVVAAVLMVVIGIPAFIFRAIFGSRP